MWSGATPNSKATPSRDIYWMVDGSATVRLEDDALVFGENEELS